MSELGELIDICKEILLWVKFSNIGKVKEVLETILDDDQKKLVYDLSDGENGTVTIGNMSGVSQGTVSNWWTSWKKLGIGESISVSGGTRFKRLFDLRDFGIRTPNLPSQSLQEDEDESNEQ